MAMAAALWLLRAATPPPAATCGNLVVGTFCNRNDGLCSSAVYSFGLDFETGALTPTAVAGGSGQSMADSWGGATGYNCSFVTPLPATASKFYTQTFYCPNEAGYGRHIPGAVRAFRMQDHVCQTRGFKAVGDIGETGGEMPPHISVDRSGGFLLVANYGSGHVSSVRLERNASDKARAHGIVCADPVKGGKHEAARCPPASAVYVGGAPHSVYATPDNKCVLSPNINLDRVYAFNFDAKTGELTNASFVQSPKGTGPRHLAFVPADPQTVWVLNEPSTTLTGWKLATDGCGLTPFGANYSTLRPNDNRSEWHSAEIRARGKYLYVSNRFKCTSASQQCNGTIATFEIGGDGTLRLVGHVDSGGHCPRVFDLDPAGRWLVVGNGGIESEQFSGGRIRNVRVLRIDPATGLPAATASSTWELAWGAPPSNGSAVPTIGQGSPGGVAFLVG